jgi:hypothetical protein
LVIAFTYDPTTDRGRVRLNIYDTDDVDADRQIFTDAEIDAFLAMNAGVVKMAAANALEAMAASQIFRLKVMRNMDLSLDGAKVGDALRKLAKSLRDDWDAHGDGTYEGQFDWAEFADTRFAKRERVVKEAERDS